MISKKGAVPGQILIYAISIVVVGFILLYGFRAVMQSRKSADEMVMISFEHDLKNDVDTMKVNYGSIRTFTYDISSKYNIICFASKGPVNESYPVINKTLEQEIKRNVFLGLKKENGVDIIDSFYVDGLNTTIRCFNITNGRLVLRLEGKGSSVAIG